MFLQEIETSVITDIDCLEHQEINKRIRHVQAIREQLKKRFKIEYLGKLREETQHHRKSRPLTVGYVVVRENNLRNRTLWSLARIMELIPGKDGHVRVTRVRIETGELVRQVQRLYNLELLEPEINLPKEQTDSVIRTRRGRKAFAFMNQMDYCSRFPCLDYPWQATAVKIAAELRYKVRSLANSSLALHPQDQRKFTPEAIFMIFVVLLFILLAAIGTAITIFEYFDKTRKRRTSFSENEMVTKNSVPTYKERETIENSPHKVRLKTCKDYLNCFCVATNGGKIISLKSTDGDFGCLHGLRFISNIWVIAFHVVPMSTLPSTALEELKALTKHWTAPLFVHLSYSVDVFFVISGFLNGYLFSREYAGKSGEISWLNFYIKRFLRITPLHLMVFWTYTTLFTYTGSGPLWPNYDTNPVCRKYWWWDLLYINNFLSNWRQCLVVNWYLAVDMQLYVMSPLFMVALLRRPRLGYGLMTLLICGSSVYNFLTTMQYDLVDGIVSFSNYFKDRDLFLHRFNLYLNTIYGKTHTRMAPYFVGLALGQYLWNRGISKAKSSNKMILCCGWIMTAILMWICLWVFYFSEGTLLRSSFYNSTSDLLFSFGIAWIVFVCVTEQGGFVNRLLSLKVFLPLSRLSYCAYLTNIILLTYYFLSSEETGTRWSTITTIYIFIYVIFWTYLISFLASLFLEIPVSRLFQCYISKRKRSKE
ncbi:nose resistant to fluoxetine protein 6 [Trichonephila clavata]|uniref:Nose resistant to fluoxetine protein 6 n=1 Tax=Trichonephila clavata TaxID=2740835 RepID=A0A8X6FBV8_TRICU|nr:nose resistant to fluoxetine protein 6 [Trichonephila clavata]